MKRTKITPTLHSIWPSYGMYLPLPCSILCCSRHPFRELEGGGLDPRTCPLFHLFPPLSIFCLSSYFSNHLPHLYSSPTYCFICFTHICLSTENKNKNKNSHFFASQIWLHITCACMYTFTHVLVYLFNRSLLSVISVVGTGVGSQHTVAH